MGIQFDDATIERLRALPPRDAFRAVQDAVYGSGSVGSEDFLDAYEQLIEREILSWDQINEFDVR